MGGADGDARSERHACDTGSEREDGDVDSDREEDDVALQGNTTELSSIPSDSFFCRVSKSLNNGNFSDNILYFNSYIRTFDVATFSQSRFLLKGLELDEVKACCGFE